MKLRITIYKGMILIASFISMLWFKNLFKVFTHIDFRYSDSSECLSAESNGLIYVDSDKQKKGARGYVEYEIPLTEKQHYILESIIQSEYGKKYDYYFYFRRFLNVMLILTIPLFIYSLIFFNLITVATLIVLYVPVNWYLWKRSKKTWACSEFVSYALKQIGIDFGYSKHTQADPDDMKYKIDMVVNNKDNDWRRI